MTHLPPEPPPAAPGDPTLPGNGPAGLAGAAEPFSDVLERLSARSGSYSRYRIHGEVARGGMGAILHVRDEDLHRDLAMKVVLTRGETQRAVGQHGVEARLLGRFLEEAQVTGQLDHPGIVPVHELGLDASGRVYFTMRLVAGRDLEKIFLLVRDGQEGWTLVRAVGAILKMCEAVAYAHSKGVLHRDLKPANVMVGRFGEVYVMDWGLARVLGREDRRDLRLRAPREESTARIRSDLRETTSGSLSPLLTMDGDIVGTPSYMSPEQARGDLQTIGPASDVFAIGAILYRLLAGHVPYAPPGSTLDAVEVWRAVRDGPPHPIRERAPDAPAELAAICEKAMAREPERRYAGMLDLAEDLRAWLEGRVVGAYERGALAQVRKWILRNKALAGTIAAAMAMVLIGSTTTSLVLARKNEQLSNANVQISESEKRALEGERRAQDNEEVAKRNAALADERAARILRLSDMKRLEELETRAATLWPAEPGNVAEYEGWLAEARALAGRLPEHEKALADIRGRGKAAEGGPEPGPQVGSWTFATAEDRWQHDTQEDLVDDLRSFAAADKGRIADVEKRLEFARTIEERSVTGDEARRRWESAVASIANEGASPKYGGLTIVPQVGLFPLGRDPRSGLWEFAHLQTGEPAVKERVTAKLSVEAETGLVFVLLPGGTFAMGAQSATPDEPNFDPQAAKSESPVHEVTLAPFFISKYEMTQGQWERIAGRNPSIYDPTSSFFEGESGAGAHPVEQVSWTDCDELLAKLGLVLPTEAQWEYAARAGTGTPWWTGEERESLEGAANVADQSAARVGATWPGIAEWPELDDGFPVHAPVYELRANAFGLHGVHGNVFEWCRDWFGPSPSSERVGDGERDAPEHKYRVNRGGGFYQAATVARSSHRNNSAPDTRSNHLGLRPARALTR